MNRKKLKTLLPLFLVILYAHISYAQTVNIGNQIWMTKNLNVDKFQNGDSIPQAKTKEEWNEAAENKQPAWCYYDNDPANGAKYGKLYNWYAVNDSRGLAPSGYHIPSDAEWEQLIDFLGRSLAGKKMKSTNGWNYSGNGTNTSGFSGLPSGGRCYYGKFLYLGGIGIYWTSMDLSTETTNSLTVWGRYLNWDRDTLGRGFNNKNDGYAVRCLKD
jgi:uncharacterized protein (TIGR02145 family)